MPEKIRLYNTFSEKKEILKPIKKGAINLFVCGPTVYDYAHLGHARTYLVFDAFVRYLRSLGFKVFYLQNITDVDDKIINRAKKEKTNPLKLAEFFEKSYYGDMKRLGINSVNCYARASYFIRHITKQIQILLKKGYAYKIENDGYYFDISRFPRYGKLSKRTIGQAEDAVSRIDGSVHKRNKGDFCLWKLYKDADKRRFSADSRGKKFAIVNGEPLWKTSLGWGRPGWHIEDTAITKYFFSSQYDIHGGGTDLKFPHHEAEIAQAEAASGKKPLARIWMHSGSLLVKGKKMSKSLRNFITIKDFLKKYSPDVLRLMILSHHYRMPINYSDELAVQAEKNFDDLSKFLKKIDFRLDFLKKGIIDIVPWKERHSFAFPIIFKRSLANDLNTPAAISILFHAMNYGNKYLRLMKRDDLIETRDFINKSLGLLGMVAKKPKIPERIRRLAAKRESFRRNKQFTQSDALRKKIASLGYIIEDTNFGPFLWPTRKS